MLAYFIIYEQDGHTGNDFTPGNISPYQWLVEARKKYPKSYIALKSFSQEAMPDHLFNQYNKLIGIEEDNKQIISMNAKKKADNKAPVEPVTALPEKKGAVSANSSKQGSGNNR